MVETRAHARSTNPNPNQTCSWRARFRIATVPTSPRSIRAHPTHRATRPVTSARLPSAATSSSRHFGSHRIASPVSHMRVSAPPMPPTLVILGKTHSADFTSRSVVQAHAGGRLARRSRRGAKRGTLCSGPAHRSSLCRLRCEPSSARAGVQANDNCAGMRIDVIGSRGHGRPDRKRSMQRDPGQSIGTLVWVCSSAGRAWRRGTRALCAILHKMQLCAAIHRSASHARAGAAPVQGCVAAPGEGIPTVSERTAPVLLISALLPPIACPNLADSENGLN